MVEMPWYLSLALSATAYIGLRWLIPGYVASHADFGRLGPVAVSAAPMLALLLLTPAPFALRRARRERQLIAKLRDVASLRSMSWWELEMVVRAIYARMGYSAQRLGGNGPDGGVDVVLRQGRHKTVVQCKQWKARTVSVNIVRELLGTMTAERADAGIVVTCGTFTGDSWGFAADNNITLIDGLRLVDLVRQLKPVTDLHADPHAAETVPNPAALNQRVTCPKCSGGMVERRVSSGPRAGNQFLGCTRYPVCKGTRPL